MIWDHLLAIDSSRWACGMAAAMARAMRTSDPVAGTVVDLFCGGGLGAVGWSGRCWTREGVCV